MHAVSARCGSDWPAHTQPTPPALPVPNAPPVQICSATSRLLVHRDIAPAFFAQLKRRAEGIKVGARWWGS